MEIFDNPRRNVPQPCVPRSYRGMRPQAYEMVTLRIGTQILEQMAEPRIAQRVDRAVDVIMNRYWNPHISSKENYHHPRYLILNLLAVERMIERSGAAAGD